MFTNPTVADFKAYFVRDFPYGSTLDTIIDQDIANAISEAYLTINPNLFDDQEAYTFAFLLLTAHSLVMNIRASSQGLSGSFSFLENSRGVGGVSTGMSIPQGISENPVFSVLFKTNYGARYMNFILPLLIGQTFTVCGGTTP